MHKRSIAASTVGAFALSCAVMAPASAAAPEWEAMPGTYRNVATCTVAGEYKTLPLIGGYGDYRCKKITSGASEGRYKLYVL